MIFCAANIAKDGIRHQGKALKVEPINAFNVGGIFMKKSVRVLMSAPLVLILLLGWGHSVAAQTDQKWKPHDRNRPAPAAVDPGMPGTETSPGRAPADAIVLFDGHALSQWT